MKRYSAGVQYRDYNTHARVARKLFIRARVVCNMRRCLAKTVQKSHSGERVFYSGNTLSDTNRIQDKHSLLRVYGYRKIDNKNVALRQRASHTHQRAVENGS